VTPMVLRNSGRVGSRRFQEEALRSERNRGAFLVCTTLPGNKDKSTLLLLYFTIPISYFVSSLKIFIFAHRFTLRKLLIIT
ncbi:hypothetical protein, partial [uncultured Bacteroides sp.]